MQITEKFMLVVVLQQFYEAILSIVKFIDMKTSRISLKDYIISNNYKKQVESHSKHKNKPKYMKASAIDTNGSHKLINQSTIAQKISEIKLYARQIIVQDALFVKLEKMLTQLLHLFVQQINLQRNQNNIVNEMLKLSAEKNSKSNLQTPSQNHSINNKINNLFAVSKPQHAVEKKQQLENSIQKRISQHNNTRMRINEKMQEINRKADGNKQSSKVSQKELEKPPTLYKQKQINREVKNDKKVLSSSVILKDHGQVSTNRSHKNASFYRSTNNNNNAQQKTEDHQKKNINDVIRKFSYIPLNNQQTSLANILAKGRTIAQIRQVFK